MDVVKICDVVNGCEDCPKYGDDCDGDKMTEHTDIISRADAIDAVCGVVIDEFDVSLTLGYEVAEKALLALPSAEAVQGEWRTGKPTKQGKYIVTLDSFGHKRIDLFYYGKPMMPNRKVRGKCWYRSDDEWGDVVYDDDDIIAWMPLPKPYRKESEVEE